MSSVSLHSQANEKGQKIGLFRHSFLRREQLFALKRQIPKRPKESKIVEKQYSKLIEEMQKPENQSKGPDTNSQKAKPNVYESAELTAKLFSQMHLYGDGCLLLLPELLSGNGATMRDHFEKLTVGGFM
jgi:hypothetical protein